jgi:hypothetical protein
VKFAITFPEAALVISGPPALDQSKPEVKHGDEKIPVEKPKQEKTIEKPRAVEEKRCCNLL